MLLIIAFVTNVTMVEFKPEMYDLTYSMNIYAMTYVWVNVCMKTTFIFAFIWIMYVFVIIFRDHCLFAVFTYNTTLHYTNLL